MGCAHEEGWADRQGGHGRHITISASLLFSPLGLNSSFCFSRGKK